MLAVVFGTPWELVVYGMTAGMLLGGCVYFMVIGTGRFWRQFFDGV
jgi:hypothetical protein